MSNTSEKPADVSRTIEYLNRAFANAMHKASEQLGSRDNSKGSTLYEYQVDFCYLVDEIQRGSSFTAKQAIQEANALIERLEHEGE